jgi:hypothetical protein
MAQKGELRALQWWQDERRTQFTQECRSIREEQARADEAIKWILQEIDEVWKQTQEVDDHLSAECRSLREEQTQVGEVMARALQGLDGVRKLVQENGALHQELAAVRDSQAKLDIALEQELAGLRKQQEEFHAQFMQEIGKMREEQLKSAEASRRSLHELESFRKQVVSKPTPKPSAQEKPAAPAKPAPKPLGAARKFPFASDPLSGIISNLTAKCGDNVHSKGVIEITAAETNPAQYGPDIDGSSPRFVADLHSMQGWYDKNHHPAWIRLDFKFRPVHVSSYSVKFGKTDGMFQKQYWVLQGSTDNVDWAIIDDRSRNNNHYENFSVEHFHCQGDTGQYFRYIRIYKKEFEGYWGGSFQLRMTALKLFGEIDGE